MFPITRHLSIQHAMLLIAALLARSVVAQTALKPLSCENANVREPLNYEVATVKVSHDQTAPRGAFTLPSGKVRIQGLTLRELVEIAFGLDRSQVSAGPSWADTERFDILASPPDGLSAPDDNPINPKGPLSKNQRGRLQGLLAERFGLTLNFHSQLQRVLELRVGHNAPKFHVSTGSTEYPYVGLTASSTAVESRAFRATNVSMSYLAQRLGHFLQVPVVDQTGLPGAYTFEMSMPFSADDDDTLFITRSLDDIGLHLDRGEAPVCSVQIVKATQPSPN